ncbi:polymeric immunoglobulin receptor-like [Sylvia atricapilla]|uniref:polymeric immunoglobulin receptor-like n=1 Tax=Sylvia atricapilla TaxID=48155 RepID=UPI0033952D03
MELRALFLLPLCFPGLQGQTPETLRLREGDTLYVKCPYKQTENRHSKYWCRLSPDGKYQEVVDTYYGSKDKRITIKDDTTSMTVSITITDLKAEDSGTYYCAVYTGVYKPLRIISLNVFKELLKWELDTLSVQCPNWMGMAWCRREQTGCTVLAERPTYFRRGATKPLQDRASITYNNAEVFTVTMEKLQTSDSGVYWCALDSGRTQIREVVLSVFKRTQQHTVEKSGNVSVHCHYKIADYKAVSKAWCKKEEGETCDILATTSSELVGEDSPAREGVRIQDDTQQGIVTVTMEQVQDSGVYWCALQESSGLSRMEEVTLNVSKALLPRAFPGTEGKNEGILLGDSPEPSSNGNTLIILSVVLFILLLLALVTSTALGVRHYKFLRRSGNREAEDTSDRAEGTAQPGSTGRRGSSQDDSKGLAYINLDVQSQPRPEDPLYCNVETSQAHRMPQHVEYAVIAFSQSPRSSRE